MPKKLPRPQAAKAPLVALAPEVPAALDPADSALLAYFPARQNYTTKRPVFFERMPNIATLATLDERGYEPTHILAINRDDELGHRNFLLAMSQGMAEGTIPPSKERLTACELDMRAHGMLNKYGPANASLSKRKQSVEAQLESWQKGHHALGQSTVMDPRMVENLLREKAGIISGLREVPKSGKLKHRYRRKTRGTERDQ